MSAGADVSFYANVYVGEFQARKRDLEAKEKKGPLSANNKQ